MGAWPNSPVVYEINTWAWLDDLSREAGRRVTLGGVPQAELERIADYRFDALWLMGVWERSPGARALDLSRPDLRASFQAALPDYAPEDVVGSPYAVYRYSVDPALGGDEGLAALRGRLSRLGLSLILDFVPNHLALDHEWTRGRPDLFVRGGREELNREPHTYFDPGGAGEAFAHGRDPFFPAWPDTVQLDYRLAQTRRATADALVRVAECCDGVRCDMAMLVTRDVFLRTWGGQFDAPGAEFWPETIERVKRGRPDFLMLAEVYWDLEYELQRQGFDYTYDKRLYDRLLAYDAAGVRAVFREGRWRLLEPREAWPGNPTHLNFVAYGWTLGEAYRLLAVNLSGDRSQCYVPQDSPALAGTSWELNDLLCGNRYVRDGDGLLSRGLYLDMPAHGHHLFDVRKS